MAVMMHEPKVIPTMKLYETLTTADDDPHAGMGPPTSLNACIEPGWSWRSHVFRIQYVQDTIHLNEPWPAFQVCTQYPWAKSLNTCHSVLANVCV